MVRFILDRVRASCYGLSQNPGARRTIRQSHASDSGRDREVVLMKKLVGVVVLAAFLGVVGLVEVAEACGGVTATIADDPKALGGKALQDHRGIPYYQRADGSAVLPASAVKVESALAEAIARRYLEKTHGKYNHLEFEGFTYDHGDFVYMYHAEVPGLAEGVHVGPLAYVTSHAHVHVSAITGDVYGPGCGIGSGEVVMPFEPKAYPAELKGKRLPYRQFDSHFVIRDGKPPVVDGRIEPGEWADAARMVVQVGPAKDTMTEYG